MKVVVSRELIEAGEPGNPTKCPLALALKSAYMASFSKVIYSGIKLSKNNGYRLNSHAILRWDNPLEHPVWDLKEYIGENKQAIVRLKLPPIMGRWALNYDRIGNARSGTFQLSWTPPKKDNML